MKVMSLYPYLLYLSDHVGLFPNTEQDSKNDVLIPLCIQSSTFILSLEHTLSKRREAKNDK